MGFCNRFITWLTITDSGWWLLIYRKLSKLLNLISSSGGFIIRRWLNFRGTIGKFIGTILENSGNKIAPTIAIVWKCNYERESSPVYFPLIRSPPFIFELANERSKGLGSSWFRAIRSRLSRELHILQPGYLAGEGVIKLSECLSSSVYAAGLTRGKRTNLIRIRFSPFLSVNRRV